MINPVFFRLGTKKNWSLRFIEQKSVELKTIFFKTLEITIFLKLFFKLHGLKISFYKLFLKKYKLLCYIDYHVLQTKLVKHTIFKQVSLLLTVKQSFKVLNFSFFRLQVYLNKKYNQTMFEFLNNKTIFFTDCLCLNWSFKRLAIVKFVKLIKLKAFNLNQLFCLNKFINQFFISLHVFLNYKSALVFIFRQLLKNYRFNVNLLCTKKQIVNCLLQLRKYNKFKLFKHSLNFFMASFKKINQAQLFCEFLGFNWFNKIGLPFFAVAIRFLQHLFSKFLFKLKAINCLKLVLSGNFVKNAKASRQILTVGALVNCCTINNKLLYHDTTCFTNKGTIGIKTFTC